MSRRDGPMGPGHPVRQIFRIALELGIDRQTCRSLGELAAKIVTVAALGAPEKTTTGSLIRHILRHPQFAPPPTTEPSA